MSEKRFIRNIMGNIYDSKTDKWFEEDYKGKPLDYDDDLIVFLNEQQDIIGEQKIAIDEMMIDYKKLEKENEQLHQKNTKLIAKIDFLERVIDGDV